MSMEQVKRSRRNAKEIKALLESFDSSEMTVKQFCTTNGLSETVFYKWRGRYRAVEENNDFIALQVSSSSSSGLFAEVNGIRIYQTVSASFLKELLP
jgi:hypothetical protein